MKKILFGVMFLMSTLLSQAQWTLPQQIGGTGTIVSVGGGFKAPNGVIFGTFADTTAANATHADFYEGCLIVAAGDLHLRKNGAWVKQPSLSVVQNLISDSIANNKVKIIPKEPLYKDVDSLKIKGGDSILKHIERVGDSIRTTRLSGDTESVYAPLSSILDTTNLHGRGVAYYQLEGDSAVLTLNDSSKYSVAIGGGGGAEKYITAGYGVTVDSSVANVYEVGVDTATVLEITNPRPAYHIFGNNTGSSAAPTWGKLNINSIDATGTPGSGNVLAGDGTWRPVPTLDSAFLRITASGIGSTSVFNKGLYLRNLTNGNLQTSPAITFETNYTNPNYWQVYSRQIGYTPNSSELIFANKYNTGSLNEVIRFNSVGGITAGSLSAFGGTVAGTTGNFIQGGYTGGAFTHSYDNIGASMNKFFTIRNTISGTLALPQYSPGLRMYGAGNNGSVSQVLEFVQQVRPISGTNPITGNLHWFSQVAALGDVEVMRISNTGLLAVPSSVIGGTTPAATALLDLQSTTQGLKLPNMTTAQINAIGSPATGLTVYNTTENTICFYNGSSWQKVTSTNL